jgi:hypothetical protein
MKATNIVAPFALSAVLSILTYLSSKDSGTHCFPIMLLGIPIALELVGSAATLSDK